ncbi:MAG: N-6 DNA methylase [Candidatus Sericytochromatia bacterium]|nr:N-6 DNA methylase [Candidatus Sericytochromatia bacterium]
MTMQTNSILYSEIKKIVWAFADMVRDKGNGTVEDYAKIVLPTCLVKRTLDLQAEFNKNNGSSFFELVEMGASSDEQALSDINLKSYRFYDNNSIKENNLQPSIVLITWADLMGFQDNPNGDERQVGVGQEGSKRLMFNQVYVTKAKNFVELMFEIIEALNTTMKHVFTTFEYRQLILQKNIVPFSEFYKTCHAELSKYEFNMENISTDMFSDIYMDLMGRFASDAGKKGGEFFTPTPLVKNAWQFTDIKDYARKLISGQKTHISIGDPTSGSNTFLIYGYDLIMAECEKMEPGKVSKAVFSFYGQELKAFQYCLGLINMIFHNTIDTYNAGIEISDQNSNVITDYKNGIGRMRGQLDIVVANPPYGTKNYGIEYAQANKSKDDRWKFGVPKKAEGEYAFLMTIYDLLNKQGKAVIVMPLGTLFRDSAKEIRKHLLQEDIIEGIVTLPGNMFLTTSIPVVLWILNKDKKEADKGKVFMVNASKDFKKVGKFNNWQEQKAIQNYLERIEEVDYCGYADFATLEKNKFNLSVQRYFSKEKEKEIVDIVSLEKEIIELETNLVAKKSQMNSLISQVLALEVSDE